MMNTRYFFSLWARNAGGVLKGGLVPIYQFSFVAPFIWIPHLVLLPLTLTLGAGFKTLFDCLTRKFTPEVEVKSRLETISKMSDSEINGLVEIVREYNDAKSHSSKEIQSSLNNLVQNEKRKTTTDCDRKLQMLLAVQRETQNNLSRHPMDYSKLNEKNNKDHADFSEKAKNLETKIIATQSKTVIIDFLQKENNNGKEMFNRLMRFFKPSTSVEVQRANEPKDGYQRDYGITTSSNP